MLGEMFMEASGRDTKQNNQGHGSERAITREVEGEEIRRW
jgi:hypothetical protein